ncbi:MAG: N-acetylmuramoyl-L-alanine amidase, partial [Polyangiales bacterium]
MRDACTGACPRVSASAARAFALWAATLGLALGCDEPAATSSAARSSEQLARKAGSEPTETPSSGEVIPDSEVAGWAKRAGQGPKLVDLQQVEVYGAQGRAAAAATNSDARVVLRFDGVAVYRRSELAAEAGVPRRLVLDLDGARLGPDVGASRAVGAGGLARVRTFALDQDHVRVSFDVAKDTAYRLFFLSDPYRIVMDFRGAAVSSEVAVQRRPLLIVLDPGHGGDQPGAKGPDGMRESNVALAIARKVRQALKRELPQARVVMTRDDGRFVSLEERAAIANALDA